MSIAVLGLGLAALTVILLLQDVISRRRGLHRLVRITFLLWTLVWLGWYAGAQITVVDRIVTEARIALTGVAPVPHRAVEAERILVGGEVDALEVDAAADAVRSVITPSGDLHATADYRRDIAGVLLGRAVAAAARRATEATERVA